MQDPYRDYIRHENIKHFRRKLISETDPERRATLKKLLAEELARFTTNRNPSTDARPVDPRQAKSQSGCL